MRTTTYKERRLIKKIIRRYKKDTADAGYPKSRSQMETILISISVCHDSGEKLIVDEAFATLSANFRDEIVIKPYVDWNDLDALKDPNADLWHGMRGASE